MAVLYCSPAISLWHTDNEFLTLQGSNGKIGPASFAIATRHMSIPKDNFLAAEDEQHVRPISSYALPIGRVLATLWQKPSLLLLGSWLFSLLMSLWLAKVQLHDSWYQLPVKVGGLDFFISIYPPLTISTLWVLWFGFRWGIWLAFAATFLVAMLSGLPLGWGVLFSFSNPLGLLLMALVYRNIHITYAPSSLAAILLFVVVCFISGVSSASGSFIWSYMNKLSALDAFTLWQGWWVGNTVQTLITVMPLLLLTPLVLRWREKHWPAQMRSDRDPLAMLVIVLFMLASVLGFLWLSFWLADRSVLMLDSSNLQDWQRKAALYRESAVAVYWVLSVLMLSLVFLGYRFYQQRTAMLHQAALRIGFERDLALLRQQETEVARLQATALNAELEQRLAEIDALQQELRYQALHDPLTGLYNRHYLYEQLGQYLGEGRPMALALIDLDHFKLVNDRHGHGTGDEVLRQFARLCQACVYGDGFVVRYGGEEFCIVQPDATAGAMQQTVQLLQRQFAASHISSPDDGSTLNGLTFSGGVVDARQQRNYSVLLQSADEALYRAKEEGRNRVCQSV